MKKWYNSKTIHLAIAQAVFGVLAVVMAEYPEYQSIGWVAIIKSFLDMWIRYNTGTPIKPVDNQEDFID